MHTHGQTITAQMQLSPLQWIRLLGPSICFQASKTKLVSKSLAICLGQGTSPESLKCYYLITQSC